MTERAGSRGACELQWDEEIVRDGIGGEMCQVTKREGAQRIVCRAIANLEANAPRMTVSPFRRVFLGDGRIGGKRPVHKIEWVLPKESSHARREHGQVPQNRIREKRMRPRGPGPRI